MHDPEAMLALLNTGAFLLCVGFLVYVLCILRPFLRRRDSVPGTRAGHDFHLVVPCLNEEDVIAATVRHLTTDFPDATVWIVDDGSTDATPLLLAALADRHQNLRVLTRRAPEARQGKGAALNAAWRAISAELPVDADRDKVIVGVVDADARLERVCPDVICGPAYFGARSVVAVQVQVRITQDVDALVSTDPGRLGDLGRERHRDPLLVQLQDMEFTGTIAAMQTLRQRTGSVAMGGNGQFTRMSGLDRIAREHGTPWHGALLEDFELGLHVLLTGGRTEYCDDTFVAQLGLTRLKPLIRQRSRWAQGGIQCLRYLWQVLCSPRVPLGGALEVAYYLYVPWSQMLGSVVFPTAIAVDAYYAFSTGDGPADWWAAGAWGLVPLALLFGVLPQFIWGPIYRARTGGVISRRRAVWLGLANIGYGYLLQAAVWWAFTRTLRRRTDWKKTARTDQAGAAPAPLPLDPAPAGSPVLIGSPR
ncbi:glycosyltransferase family 2 protein [Modestobacter roseus]|uniref:Cellulose synthase/poly-beta-1,6-N-acetylglucosamine synthase-like glycosyltransferase n=1 Tax=Modestobacter roseus TaxID=1181884 RepID=A0A562IYQ9_9ACTN|nr:glycosyltransferase family 2 protein [Modestobacter roseus]MQA32753.1 glycosyltransferase [Modestobacter roseus]TWH75745.1 cellulose synthase/poly-beta-1,6-N-acetylglucosamine synthase-like glycosyltransferase [Modestobacter roseus]